MPSGNVTGRANLAARAAALAEEALRHTVIPTYFRTDLTWDEQVHRRGKPLPYLKVATTLVKEYGLQTIVEIGSMRLPMQHALDEFNPVCCNDGHSTAHFAATGADVFTVDADPRCAAVLEPFVRRYPKLKAFTGDGIAFLAQFKSAIDLLYLDAWDVATGTNYAEKHLEAYRTALPKLAASCLVQIDDTDILNGGKGRLAIPRMIRDGFELVTWGRQAILARG